MKLLIVEDHSAMRKTLRSIIQSGLKNPVEFIECDNGEDAVELSRIHHPDYILMDIQLKQMDGFTASDLILTENPVAKIIIVTSHNSPSYRTRASKLKVKGMVLKDNLAELTQLIN